MPVQTYISGGYVVGYSPEFGVVARTSLDDAARREARRGTPYAAELVGCDWSELEGVTGEEIEVGRFGRRLKKIGKKIKKGAKKVGKPLLRAAKTVVRTAHKVTQSKLVKGIERGIQKMVPQPFKSLVTVHNKIAKQAHKLIKRASAKPKKGASAAVKRRAAAARKIAPLVKRSAAGQIPIKKVLARAKKLRVPTAQVKAAAALGRLELLARAGDPKAIATKQVTAMLQQARSGQPQKAVALLAENELRKRYPNARTFSGIKRGGRTYNAIVVPVQ